jgi:hypothetical protein
MLVKVMSLPKMKIPFTFFDFWADHPRFLPLIFKARCKEVTGTPMFVLCNKLKNVKGVFKEFNKKYFGQILKRVLESKWAMEKAQCLMQANPSYLEIHRAGPLLVKVSLLKLRRATLAKSLGYNG